MEMWTGFGVDDQATATCLHIARRQDIGGEDHQVSLEGLGGVLTGRGDDIGAKGQVRDELSVHDVPLEEVNAGGVKGFDLGSKFGEVAGQDGWGDQNR